MNSAGVPLALAKAVLILPSLPKGILPSSTAGRQAAPRQRRYLESPSEFAGAKWSLHEDLTAQVSLAVHLRRLLHP